MISLAIVYVGLAVLGPLCALAQRLWPASAPPVRALARDRRLDWLYWLVTPLGTGVLTRTATLGVAAVIAVVMGWRFHDADELLAVFHAHSPLVAWPLPAQALLALVLADFLSYWSHRVRHHPAFFPLHAVHHSVEKLDWLAAARMHPIDDLFDNVAVSLPVLFLGVDPRIFVALGPVLILHTLFLHMNVRLRLGPLRFVLATPDFHRWHHALDPAAQDTNFAGILSLWDVLFGSFRLPAERPTAFGVEPKLPETLGGQLVEPLRRLIASGR